jgi:CHAT domain-containing protein
LKQAPTNLRGFAIKTKPPDESEASGLDFHRIVTAYRHLLSKPSLSRSEEIAVDEISRKLYDLLLAPLEDYFAGKTELLIIPEGILAFVPFETLKMPDGRYLVERYDIRYAQSLAINEMIEKRIALRNRGAARQDGEPALLAFGGAVYNPETYQDDMHGSEGTTVAEPLHEPDQDSNAAAEFGSESHFSRFREETLSAMNRNMSARGAYAALGLAGWSNLPGTLAEVKSIGRIVGNSTIVTGGEAGESRVKELSHSGALKNYRIVHFATHGIVVPDFPELSAIVLSLESEGDGGDDGYLTMKEISRLDMDADFVNLSACETGLGAVYSGEGIVGLTQAFLVAGANGLSVSLWQVADDSTMKLMVGLYELVSRQDLTYYQALNEMKRRFIRDPDYQKPFYWAPFVYYGK